MAEPGLIESRVGRPRESRLTEQLIGQLGYIGIALILILGGLGLPIPEEAPIIVAAVLSRNGQMVVPVAFVSCLAGVILGDFTVYALGYFYGEKVLSFRLAQRFLTRQREAQIKGYFQRHGFKILVSGRFVPGFRTAAYLTAGILKLPPLKLLLTDLVAATLSTSMMFGLGYALSYHIQSGIAEAQKWLLVLLAAGVCGMLLWRYYRAPVLDGDDGPLPSEPPLDAKAPLLGLDDMAGAIEPSIEGPRPDATGSAIIGPGIDQPEPVPAGSPGKCAKTEAMTIDQEVNSRADQKPLAVAADPSGIPLPRSLGAGTVHRQDRSGADPAAAGVALEIDPSGAPATIE